jgi:hypothetical protein
MQTLEWDLEQDCRFQTDQKGKMLISAKCWWSTVVVLLQGPGNFG